MNDWWRVNRYNLLQLHRGGTAAGSCTIDRLYEEFAGRRAEEERQNADVAKDLTQQMQAAADVPVEPFGGLEYLTWESIREAEEPEPDILDKTQMLELLNNVQSKLSGAARVSEDEDLWEALNLVVDGIIEIHRHKVGEQSASELLRRVEEMQADREKMIKELKAIQVGIVSDDSTFSWYANEIGELINAWEGSNG